MKLILLLFRVEVFLLFVILEVFEVLIILFDVK